MCGLTGFWDQQGKLKGSYDAILRQMEMKIAHRGPDDHGVWFDEDSGLGLAHRRLSIRDLSPLGHQPMLDQDTSCVLAYNGEIYNAEELKLQLVERGHRFKGTSDTEVILYACKEWGVQEAVSRFNGMFAFAYFDRKTKTLSLVRDRMGIKPLYWGIHNGLILFGSQLSSFKAVPNFHPQLNLQAIGEFLRLKYIPAPLSIYEGIYKVNPGEIITLSDQFQVERTRFWDILKVAQEGQANPCTLSREEATDHLDNLLKDAVKRRFVADVPLGAFLSGGIDSSTIVAMMQAQSTQPIKTYTVGFHEQSYNEAPYAKDVATHLKTDHSELYLSSQDVLSAIPKMPEIYDEPFADSSQVPTYLISAFARQHVTVSLSGDGGDELFGGYNRYKYVGKISRLLKMIPYPLRKAVSMGLLGTPDFLLEIMAHSLPSGKRPRHFSDKVNKFARALGTSSTDSLFLSIISTFQKPYDFLHPALRDELVSNYALSDLGLNSLMTAMQTKDMQTYLPEDILTKVDRASMAVGLEARVPILDYRVVTWALSLPDSFKIHQGVSKYLLRSVLERYVPSSFIDRPKMGFGLPFGDWMRKGPLMGWMMDLLSPVSLQAYPFLEEQKIRKELQEFLATGHNPHHIWSLLMLVSWLRKN